MSKLPPARERTRSSGVTVKRDFGDGRVGKGDVLTFSAAGEEAMKAATSTQIADPFKDNYLVTTEGELSLVEPPYNFAVLNNLPHENAMLRQCVEAMVTNCEGHGWRLEYVGPEDQEESAAAVAEKQAIEDLLFSANPDMTIDEVRARVRRDLETLGNAYLEIGRDTEGKVVMVAHVPGATVRLTNKEQGLTPIEVELPREGANRKVKMQKRFRRYAQRIGTNTVYFKEFGDPRKISPKTGREDPALGEEDTATEIIHLTLYAPGSAYGIPRWISQLPSILGSRQAELTNLDFFRENAIPALAVLVSGGRLTGTSLDTIETHLSGVRGRQSMNRVVVLEALGDSDAGSEDGTIPPPRVDIKPLAGERQKDGYFLEYIRECAKFIRSAFRLPPIFVGQSEDYSHATAKASYQVAESQVFGPERRTIDDVWNTKIIRTVGGKYWEIRSNPPKITDPEEVIEALKAFSEMGALTANQAIDLANEYFDLEIEQIAEEWGNLPFEMATSLLASGRLKGMEKWQEAPQAPVGPDGKPLKVGPDGKPLTQAGAADDADTEDKPERKKAVEKLAAALENARYAVAAYAIADKAERDAAAGVVSSDEEDAPAVVEQRV